MQLDTRLGLAAKDIQTSSAVLEPVRTISWKYIIILVKIRGIIFLIISIVKYRGCLILFLYGKSYGVYKRQPSSSLAAVTSS
jgi:hypothetical protein